jgi:heat shock protein HslJ
MRAVVAALIVVLAACSRTAPPAEEQAPEPPTPVLIGTSWVLEAPDPDMAPTINFNPGNRASGFTGCNQWFASLEREGDQLRFNGVGSTRRACHTPAMETERAFLDALSSTRSVAREDASLRLLDENSETVATLVQRAS